MKKSILAAASLVALIAGAPLAAAQMNQGTAPAPGQTAPPAPAEQWGAPLPPATGMDQSRDTAPASTLGLVTAAAFEGLPVKNKAGVEIGTVKDVVLDARGAISGIILGEGGVLGVGGREVLVSAAEIKPETGTEGKLTAVALMSPADNLDGFPAFSYDAANAEAGTQTLPAGGSSAAELIGSEVKTPQGEAVGKIADLVLDLAGRTANASIESGGFMGVNARHVVVAMNDLTISKTADADLDIQIDKATLDRAPRLDQTGVGTGG